MIRRAASAAAQRTAQGTMEEVTMLLRQHLCFLENYGVI
jgi:hypothetical protein